MALTNILIKSIVGGVKHKRFREIFSNDRGLEIGNKWDILVKLKIKFIKKNIFASN